MKLSEGKKNFLKKFLTVALLTLAVVLIFNRLRNLDLEQLKVALLNIPPKKVFLALILIVVDYLLLSTFDLMSLRHIDKDLPFRKVFCSSFVSYTFNFNFGSLIAGFPFRYRVYSLWGLSAGDVTKIIAISIASNWIGYLAVAGFAFTFGEHTLLASWMSNYGLKALGLGCLASVLVYLILCFRKASLSFRDHSLDIPSPQFAALQIFVGGIHWIVTSMILFVLWPVDVSFSQILITYIAAAIAAVIVHIPAGLGVTEAVFLTAFSGQVPDALIVASILVFRILYHMIPLLFAFGFYLVIEFMKRRSTMAKTV